MEKRTSDLCIVYKSGLCNGILIMIYTLYIFSEEKGRNCKRNRAHIYSPRHDKLDASGQRTSGCNIRRHDEGYAHTQRKNNSEQDVDRKQNCYKTCIEYQGGFSRSRRVRKRITGRGLMAKECANIV